MVVVTKPVGRIIAAEGRFNELGGALAHVGFPGMLAAFALKFRSVHTALGAALVLFASAVAYAGFDKSVVLSLNGSYTTTLQDGTVYRADKSANLDFSAKDRAPVKVADNATVVLYIDEGVSLTFKGAHASGTRGAFPGIQMGANSRLIVTGEGRLYATGGNAANGGSGSKGGYDAYGKYETGTGWRAYCGHGGAGGNGGGAAAAGIGGAGGNGGTGGAEVGTSKGNMDDKEFENSTSNGNKPGLKGTAGGNGGDGGTFYAMGTVVVVANPGAAGSGGGGGWYTGYSIYEASQDDYSMGGGGGGGGGAGGSQAYQGIGGGGGGGGGGGSGATGTTMWLDDYDDGDYNYTGDRYPVVGGQGGLGGKSQNGSADGTKGTDAQYARDFTKDGDDKGDKNRTSKGGGAAGGAGAKGADASVFKYDTATITNQFGGFSSVTYGEEPDPVVYSVEFVDEPDVTRVERTILGSIYPVARIPRRTGYEFRGYYTGKNGLGTMYYDQSGTLVVKNVYSTPVNLKLYASWQLRNRTEKKIVVPAGEPVTMDGRIDDELLYQPQADRLVHVKRGGALTLKNMTFVGDDTSRYGLIFNEGTLFVSNCVFDGNYTPYGWGAVYSDRPKARAVFMNCTFQGNAGYDAGVIAAEGSTVAVVNCTFELNMAHLSHPGCRAGSAVCAIDGAKLDLVSCTFVSNFTARADYLSGTLLTSEAKTGSQLLNSIVVTPSPWQHIVTERGSALASAYNVLSATTENLLGTPMQRMIETVTHTTYKPFGDGRTKGCAVPIRRNADWTLFSANGATADCTEAIDIDQLGQYPMAGWAGARTGNTLQHLIDETSPGGTLEVPPGRYDAVVVNKKIRVIGAGAEECYIDGDGAETCVTIQGGGADAYWSDFGFHYGGGVNGGGFAGLPNQYGGIVSNCVFASCCASNGGAVAWAKMVVESVFTNCVAETDGGATYNCKEVSRAYYADNLAGGNGGASANDQMVFGALIYGNRAGGRGGAGSNSSFQNCTLAQNQAGQDATVYSSTLSACVLYGNPEPTDIVSLSRYEGSFSAKLAASRFVDAAHGDFHLRIKNVSADGSKRTSVDQSDIEVTDPIMKEKAIAENWRDFEGSSFISYNPIDPNITCLYAGCYAYAPFKANGLVVNGVEEYYDDTNMRTSLREAIQEARNYPTYASSNGVFNITFDPAVFPPGSASTLVLGEAQMDVDIFTNGELRITGPTNALVTINGSGCYRAFRVRKGNRLHLENLDFYNCLGQPAGGNGLVPSADGGAILNHGALFVSNCVFAANRAGAAAGVYGPDMKPTGYGGAIATVAGATTTVWRTTFDGNRAARGGALYTYDGGYVDAFFSTFFGNAATGVSSLRPAGGAAAADSQLNAHTNSCMTFANCTFANNSVPNSPSAGGAIHTRTGLVLLNSVVVGNYSKGVTNDVEITSGGRASFFSTAYGARTEYPSNSYYSVSYTQDGQTGGWKPTEIYSRTNALYSSTIMPHRHLAIGEAAEMANAFLWVAADGSLGYSPDADAKNIVVVRGKLSSLRFGATVQRIDQLANEFVAPVSGAVAEKDANYDKEEERSEEEPGEEEPGGEEGGDDPALAPGEITPGPDVELDDKVWVVKLDGTKKLFESPAYAWNSFHPGEGDQLMAAGTNDNERLWDVKIAFMDNYEQQLLDFVKQNSWFTLKVADDYTSYQLVLNEQATPVVAEPDPELLKEGVFAVTPANVKPNLWYALAYTTDATGTFACDEDGWVKSDENGVLSGPVKAPALGEQGFYRVTVSPYPVQSVTPPADGPKEDEP